jgi:DNA-binding beta-propeller fold protein YncE
MINGADGAVYVTTYWGSSDGVQFTSGYDGDVLLRIDPSSGQVTSLGVPISKHGVPSLAGSPDGKMLYGEALDPLAGERAGLFFAYDIAQRKVVFQMDKPADVKGYRNVLVDGSGKAWFSVGDGEVAIYDPATNTATTSNVKIPGVYLRASTRPAPDGTVYGITSQPDVLFKITSDGQLHEMGPVRGYTASLAMSPDGSKLYYVPGAHGSSFEQGTPVIEVDTATGTEREVVRLNDLAEPQLHLRLGGSYDVVLDPSGSSLFVGLNAGDPTAKEAFGAVVLAVVKLH